MKTYRITMLIELVLLILGIIFSYYIQFKSNLSTEMTSLLCSYFIGLSTSGMAAFLIEIPQAISAKNQNIKILKYNALFIYIYFSQLAWNIKNLITKANDKYNDNFTKYYFNKIDQYIYPLLNLDENIFCSNIKNKEIAKLRKGLNNFKTTNIQARLTYKYNTILLNSSKDCNYLFEVKNGMVASELTDLLTNINTLLNYSMV